MASARSKKAAPRKSAKKAAAKTAAKSSAKKSALKKPSAKSASPPPSKKQSASSAVDEQLARYRSMRDFHITAEPSGSKSDAKKTANPTALPFCIQKHAASHLHYDFRLGWNGVLKSWAVAKGPSYVTADKRLAVQVEDHPMEYGGFEGIIPKGQYGGGTVMLWDQGTWEPQPAYPDVDAGLRSGSLKFILHGAKLQGKWALIRMHGKSGGSESKPNWLLIKEHDDFERPPTEPSITESEPNSVVTSRSIDQIAASEDHVWNSKDTRSGPRAWYSQPSKTPADESAPNARVPHPYAGASTRMGGMRNARSPTDETIPSITSLPRESQPAFLPPQLAQQAETPPSSAGWLHELKLDGYRIQARKSGGRVQLLTRKGLDWTHRMKPIAEEIARLSAASCTLDGEVVVLRPDGTTSFADLQASFQESARHHLTYFVFDLLHLNGRNPRSLALSARKTLLGDLIANANSDILHLSDHLGGDGPAILRNACRMHAEGIISKRADAAYCAGRSSDWIKCKCLHEQELVIGGFTLPSAGHTGMHGIGALLLGYYAKDKFVYAGRTGTGFNQKTHTLLRDKLEALTQPKSPFDKELPADQRRGARWVRPELVAQVRFATWTADHLVRQAAFLGLREDKPATEVTRETSAPTPKSSRPQNPASEPPMSEKENAGVPHSRASRVSGKKMIAPAKARTTHNEQRPTSNAPLPHPLIRLTHPDKILDPLSSLTKQALADYYYAIAPWMLPHIAGRPLSIVRCPEGSSSQCFFQKHVNATLPPGIGSVMVTDKKSGTPEPYITLVDDSATPTALASLAQLGVLELHPWGSHNSDLEHPDRLIFDLDPDEHLPWSTVVTAAHEFRDRLKKLKLTSFLKTTGGKGLHVVVPFTPSPKLDWPTVKELAHKFVLAMERENPRVYLTKMSKAARAGKIYLDYLRNERGATAVAPYSPRARTGVNVSMPLDWKEVAASGAFANKRPEFSVATFLDWRDRLKKDPWKSIPDTTQSLNPA
jgi:bifunctional non-homologous end joining protein LigD